MTLPMPTEEVEQRIFVNWLEIKGYKFTSIPNSTYTKSWSQKRKNMATGLRAGFPDMVVIANNKFMCIEMKRLKGTYATPMQRDWIAALTAAGVPAKVCHGAEEAIAFVKSIASA